MILESWSFKSERLHFREIDLSDAEYIVAWRSDPSNYMNFFAAHAVSLDEHLQWFERYLVDKTRFDFMILDEKGNRIGTVGLSNIRDESCEVNYMIGCKEARGKGYATEAVRAVIDLAFKRFDLTSVYARILPGNIASLKVAENVGFERDGSVYSIHRNLTYE